MALVEALVAALFFCLAVVSVCQLTALAVGFYGDAGETGRSLALAEDALVELSRVPAALRAGGSLDADHAGYQDAPAPHITRRWLVEAGPVPGTLSLRIRVSNARIRRGARAVETGTLVPVEVP